MGNKPVSDEQWVKMGPMRRIMWDLFGKDLPPNGQRANPDSFLIEDDKTAFFQWFSKIEEICQEEFYLILGAPFRSAAKQDNRGFGMFPQGENRAEIGIGGNENAILAHGSSSMS